MGVICHHLFLPALLCLVIVAFVVVQSWLASGKDAGRLTSPVPSWSRRQGPWQLYTIDAKRLAMKSPLYRLRTVVLDLGLSLRKKAVGQVNGSYFCLHRIPADAIVDVYTED